jgi:N-acetylmuramoyl-L-alanine amidase
MAPLKKRGAPGHEEGFGVMRFASLMCVALLGTVSAALAQRVEIPEATLPFEPPEGDRPLRGLVITIDPGHGGSAHDPGYSGSARGVNSRVVEGDLNMLVAGELLHHLRRAGADVALTRQDDRKVTLGDTDRAEELGARVRLAVQRRSHLFLALHHNSFSRRSADGVVIMIDPTDSHGADQPLEREFADILHDEVEKQVHHTEELSTYINNHPLVSGSDIPSAVVEFGFLSNPDFDAWVSQRGAHRAEAIGVYNAVVRMWQEHRPELEALRARLFPGAGEADSGDPIWRRSRPGLERVVQSLWPVDRPPENAREAERLLDLYRRTVISDSTFFLFDVHVEGGPREGWRLTGSVNHPYVKQAAARLLEAAGCQPVINQLRLLPDERVGSERHGIVQIPMALIFERPGDQGVQQTQLLLGERVWLLDVTDDGDYLLVQASDGYIGWGRRDAVKRMDAQAITDWETARRATAVRDIMVDDFRIPTGARLPIIAISGDTATVQLPRGVRATEDRTEVEVPLDHLRLPAEPSPGRVAAETAHQSLTIPYVFGGRSAGQGLDCSGLVGIAWQTAGVRLPRDTRQQVLVGELVGTSWRLGPFQPGDILFFCDRTGRITHTGLSLGGLRFIHESPPEVQVSSFDPDDPLYDAHWSQAFAFARRPME